MRRFTCNYYLSYIAPLSIQTLLSCYRNSKDERPWGFKLKLDPKRKSQFLGGESHRLVLASSQLTFH